MLNRQIEMACRGEKEVTCCVRGYHVYKDIWAAAIGEELVCGREPTNTADRPVHRSGTEARNCHWTLAKEDLESVFPVLAKGGSIRCTVTWSRRHPSDLPVLNIRRKTFCVK